MAKIVFYPTQKNFQIPDGTELLKARENDETIPLKFGCKKGGCGVCAVKVIEGESNLTKISEEEKKTLQKKGLHTEQYRLACQCAVNGDIGIASSN
jgi:ferredoxin